MNVLNSKRKNAKKNWLFLIFILISFNIIQVNADNLNTFDDFSNNCRDFIKPLKFIGILILIIKIILPLIIVIKATFDYISIVISGKEEDLKKKFLKLFYTVVASIIVFMIPRMIKVVLTIIPNYEINSDSKICIDCIFDPLSNNCNQYVEE